MSFQVSDPRVGYILNKSENATPELFGMYISPVENQNNLELDFKVCFFVESFC